MSARRSRAPIRRLAHLCALLAIILYQPLAALHFATDKAHLANAATSIQVAHLGHQHHGDHHGHSQPDHHDHQLCTFCVLAGVTLLSAAVSPALGWAADAPSDHFAVPPVRAEKRLRIGHPVRAPPRIV